MYDGTLRFKNGGFRIMQVTDTHLYGVDGQFPDIKTYRLLEHAAKELSPDMLAFSGDMVVVADYKPGSGQALREFVEYYDTTIKIPWASCFGNHDTEFGTPYETLLEAACASKFGLRAENPDFHDSNGLYEVEIYGENDPLWSLYFIDATCARVENGIHTYSYIKFSQNDIYRASAKKHPERASLFFHHHPLPEYNDMIKSGNYKGILGSGISTAVVNSGFFSAMLEHSGSRGFFCGHNHHVCLSGYYKNIMLAFGRTSGYELHMQRGSYPGGDETYRRGVRVIDITESGEMNTFVWLSDGSIMDY